MVSEPRKQSIARMETDYSEHATHALSMEDKMAAGAFGRTKNYECDEPPLELLSEIFDSHLWVSSDSLRHFT